MANTFPENIINIFGQTGAFLPPPGVEKYSSGNILGLTLLLNNILKLSIFAAGLYTLVNLIASGIQYIGSSGNPEMIKQASSRIWLSLLGLVIVAGSLVLAAVIGLIFFKDATAILSPTIPTPTIPTP